MCGGRLVPLAAREPKHGPNPDAAVHRNRPQFYLPACLCIFLIESQMFVGWYCKRASRWESETRCPGIMSNSHQWHMLRLALRSHYHHQIRQPFCRMAGTTVQLPSTERIAQLVDALASINARVAATSSSKTPPTLIAVSKYHLPSDILACYQEGKQLHFGENYVQELVDKAAEVRVLNPYLFIRLISLSSQERSNGISSAHSSLTRPKHSLVCPASSVIR